ncbi:hypothetical protein [Streptacidiphilus sp. MAP12-33]|uniref:hypothetical protein n=1 Tax=Streptacidiphilus sp. MAP12-33 TaxID=3156266 RepID=UPI00351989EB
MGPVPGHLPPIVFLGGPDDGAAMRYPCRPHEQLPGVIRLRPGIGSVYRRGAEGPSGVEYHWPEETSTVRSG